MSTPADLPISIVTEIIKNGIDGDVCLSKNTKIAFSRLGGVFILYIANLANDLCKAKKKSKILVRDVIEAMNKSGFGNYSQEINELINKINAEMIKNKELSERKKNAEENDKDIDPNLIKITKSKK